MFGMPFMGMPMPGMGMPMGMAMPMGMPIPGVTPGMPGTGWYNSLPGRFGRDMLGQDFAGPGGVGSSQPYRPPDPSALPPMPHGLPFIARPGQEGFDAYGRMLPPELPEGWDGWGRPIVSTGAQAPAPAPMPAAAAVVDPAAQAPLMGAAGPGTRDMPLTSAPLSEPLQSSMTSTDTCWPEQPPCFDREPAKSDSYYRYDDFEAFSLSSNPLNRAWELHLPRELVSHDVSEEDWMRFVDDLAKEALSGATHDFTRKSNLGRGPKPVLSDGVHSLLTSWAVAFFAPRGIRVYAAQDGQRVVPPPLEPPGRYRRGYSRADQWSDDAESATSDDDSWWSEEEESRRNEMYLPRREGEIRSRERARLRRREKRRREYEGLGRRKGEKEWEVHFVAATPTLWQRGARPRTYGEPVIRSRR